MPFGIFSWNRNLPITHQSGIQVQSKHSSSRISTHLARGEVENFHAYYYCKQIVHCMLFEAEGVSDLIICILSNQITCTTTVCLVQGWETTAKNRNENFAMPKATQVATGSFLFSNRPTSFSCWFLPIQTNIPEEMASWWVMWLFKRNMNKNRTKLLLWHCKRNFQS